MTFKRFNSFNRGGKGDFKWFGRGRKNDFFLPKLPGPPEDDITDDAEDRIFNIVDDRGIAKRVRQLQQIYPVASLPELVVMDWLQQKKIPFRYQVPVFGGRSLAGGQVLDFTTQAPTGVLVMRVQGTYYHTLPMQERLDFAQRLALRSTRVQGQPVAAVIDLWEDKILDKKTRDPTMLAALAGQETGRMNQR